jgi:cytochrome c peroxidase
LRNAAINHLDIVTPAGMVLRGTIDSIEGPPSDGSDTDHDGKFDEIPQSIVDFEEFYLLHYFKAGTQVTPEHNAAITLGRAAFNAIGCANCHRATLTIASDRRVADLETNFSPFNPMVPATSGNPLNRLFAVGTLFIASTDDGSGFPTLKTHTNHSFIVRNFFADLKRHDLGSNFFERNYEGTIQQQFITEPLWGVGTTAPYGHDGRSDTLEDVILRHGGEAAAAATAFAALTASSKVTIIQFLQSLVLFPPDDTASNLPNGQINPGAPNFPQNGHGAIALTGLFNDTTDLE